MASNLPLLPPGLFFKYPTSGTDRCDTADPYGAGECRAQLCPHPSLCFGDFAPKEGDRHASILGSPNLNSFDFSEISSKEPPVMGVIAGACEILQHSCFSSPAPASARGLRAPNQSAGFESEIKPIADLHLKSSRKPSSEFPTTYPSHEIIQKER